MTDPRDGPERPAAPPEVDAERLAALLDGRLGERERAEVLARLAASDDDFGAFVDALEVTRELEAEDEAAGGAGGGGVTPLSPRRERRWWGRPGGHWLALAAGLVGVALLPLLWMQARGPRTDDPGRYAALLRDGMAGLPADWDRSPWGTTRGPGDALSPEARAVRVGARLTDLEVAVAAGDPRAARFAAEIEAHLLEVPAGAVAAPDFREISRRAGEPPEGLRPLLERGRRGVAHVMDGEMLGLGAWAEAARIAAARRDAAFFRTRGTREALDRAAGLDLPERGRAALERVRGAAPGDGAPDWDALAAALEELLRALGG